MSRSRRPNFLPLNPIGSSRSEFYVLPQRKSINLMNNVYSPTNSIESEYSPANTPITPITPNDYAAVTPTDYYLPYLKSPIGSKSLYLKSNNQINKQQFGYSREIKSRSNLYVSNDLTSSRNSTATLKETPDWFNESINLNKSFNFYESTKSIDLSESTHDSENEDDSAFDLNRTLTNRSLSDLPYNTAYSQQTHKPSYTNNHCNDQFTNQSVSKQTGSESIDNEVNENCPILFRQLMSLAESTFIKCIKKTELTKSNQSSHLDSNMSPILTKFCKFCKNNREPRKFYLSHSTMNSNGEIVCPILQQYQCELCGSTGVKAHTRSYCPFSKILREAMPNINDTFEFYNKKSMIHSTDSQLFDNEINDELSDSDLN